MIIAVLDTEIFRRHPAFQDRMFHKHNYTPEPWGNPGAHGTSVAGIAAANSDDVMGMAPEATLYNYKILGRDARQSGDDIHAALAIEQALEDGAHIANCSFGTGPLDNYTQILDAVARGDCLVGIVLSSEFVTSSREDLGSIVDCSYLIKRIPAPSSDSRQPASRRPRGTSSRRLDSWNGSHSMKRNSCAQAHGVYPANWHTKVPPPLAVLGNLKRNDMGMASALSRISKREALALARSVGYE